MAKIERAARLFKVLSVPARLRIVQLLSHRALCVGALAARLGVTQGAVSQHLRVLRDAGLVIPERRGYYVHYRLNKTRLARWRRGVDDFLRFGMGRGTCLSTAAATTRGEGQCARRRKGVGTQTS